MAIEPKTTEIEQLRERARARREETAGLMISFLIPLQDEGEVYIAKLEAYAAEMAGEVGALEALNLAQYARATFLKAGKDKMESLLAEFAPAKSGSKK